MPALDLQIVSASLADLRATTLAVAMPGPLAVSANQTPLTAVASLAERWRSGAAPFSPSPGAAELESLRSLKPKTWQRTLSYAVKAGGTCHLAGAVLHACARRA